jgi:hypothetical protein
MIEVKILSCRSAQRYAVRQRVVAAKRDLWEEYPGLEMSILELKNCALIEPYTLILSAPSLVVNEQLVGEGRFPSREEVLDSLRGALRNDQS